MSDYVNTVSLIGDSALTDSILDGTVTEIVDDYVIDMGLGVLRAQQNLKKVVLLSAEKCPDLYNCPVLEKVVLPSLVRDISHQAFYLCKSLTYVDGGRATSIGEHAFYTCPLNTLILRREESVCAMLYANTVGSSVTVYVPAAIIGEYRKATNWSTVTKFRPLEQYTVDGTVMGELTTVFYALNTKLTRVRLSNEVTEVGPRYYATLTSANSNPIEEVVITMSGVDITADVYNAETGEISIPVVTGALKITASAGAAANPDDIEPAAFELNGSDFVNAGNPTKLNGMTLEGFDYTENSGSDGLGNIVTNGKERIVVPANVVTNAVTFAEGFTIAFKATVTDISQTQKYMCMFNIGSRQFAVIYAFVSATFELYDSSVNAFRPGSQIVVNDNDEHVVAYTHDGSTVCCYLDGSLVNRFACTYNWSTARPNTTSYILGSANMRDCFIGKLANFSVWNKALPADEIAMLFP